MQFVRIGEFLSASCITGPHHNLLQVRLAERSAVAPACECLPPVGGCTHTPLDESKLVEAVLHGTAEANARFGTSYSVAHIKYVQNDTPPETVYAHLAMKIIERLAEGGEFTVGSIPSPKTP